MSSWDLFVDGFPHSTPEGYARGCRGSSCPGVQEFGWSCTFALQQSRGDYHWSRWFREGRSPAEIVELRRAYEEPVVVAPKPVREQPKPRPVSKPAASVRPVKPTKWKVKRATDGWVAVSPGGTVTVHADHGAAVRFATGEKPKRERKHGAWAYQRGCRCDICRAANTQAQRDQTAKRRARLVDGVAPVKRHGLSTGRNWGCKCDVCVAAIAKANRIAYDKAHPTVRREYKRLTSEQIGQARALRRQDVSWRVIAAQLGVKHSTVQKAVARAEAAS